MKEGGREGEKKMDLCDDDDALVASVHAKGSGSAVWHPSDFVMLQHSFQCVLLPKSNFLRCPSFDELDMTLVEEQKYFYKSLCFLV